MNLIKREFEGWKFFEVSWLFVTCIIIASLSIYWGDTVMGVISATTGVACVVCTGKGKLMAFVFGLINCVLYAIISYKAELFGEVLLNGLYYVPMQFYGFYVWSKHMNNKTKEVEKLHMTIKNRILALLSVIIGTIGFGLFLQNIGDAMPFVDAFTTVSSIIAMVISIKMYSEQWWLWIGVDVFSVIMWAKAYMSGNDSIATLMMWIVFLGNAIIMCYKWEKEIKNKREVE